jgi:hypothetical protein
MVENANKLEAAFLAGRMDAIAERQKATPEGVEELLRMVLSESDCTSLARLSKVLFHCDADANLRLVSPVTLLPVGSRNGGTNGGKLEAS